MDITSRDNPLVKELRRLLADAKARRQSGRFVIEGARLCADAAASGVPIIAALATDGAQLRYEAPWAAVREVAQDSYLIPDSLAAYIADTRTPQGIFCLCQEQPQRLTVKPNGVYLALEDIQDPGNLGTMLRTAEALGADGLLLSKGCCDLYNPKVLRGSMGGMFRLPVQICEDFVGTLAALTATLPVLACVVDEEAQSVTAVPKTGAVGVIGNEGNGLTQLAVSACSGRITIPMAGRAESLNASMAAGIVLWELCRGKAED